jgi:hypothetical protein
LIFQAELFLVKSVGSRIDGREKGKEERAGLTSEQLFITTATDVGLPASKGGSNLDYCLGAELSSGSLGDRSFFSPAPRNICVILDIISSQLKGRSDFLASIIFRIMSPQGIPPQ